jgi:hypothetical protein
VELGHQACKHNIKWCSNKQKANLLLQLMKDNAKQKKMEHTKTMHNPNE